MDHRPTLASMPHPAVPPAIDHEGLLAALPQLPQAREWLREALRRAGLDAERLISDPGLASLRERAMTRLAAALRDPERMAAERAPTGPDAALHAGLELLYARLVACASQDESLVRRWAHAEAVQATQALTEADAEVLLIVARTYLEQVERDAPRRGGAQGQGSSVPGLRQIRDAGVWRVGLRDYIELAPKVSGADWRLVNRAVRKGWVELGGKGYPSAGQVARLVRERMRSELTDHALERMASLPEELLADLAEVAATAASILAGARREAVDMSQVEASDWPPCLRVAVDELSRGINVNHAGRVFVASMAFTLGLPQEAAVDFFRGAPDFSAETTSYQVGHIYEREYTPAGCDTLKTVARCPVQPGDDRICDAEWLKHPLIYTRVAQRRRGESAGPVAASPPDMPTGTATEPSSDGT